LHWLDRLVALRALGSKMFAHGFGDEEILERLAAHDFDEGPVPDVSLSLRRVGDAFEGTFEHPVAARWLPRDARTAHVHLRLPTPAAHGHHGTYVHLASTGDEGWKRREAVVSSALRRGVGALLLENPYYGRRRVAGRPDSDLVTIVEQLAMSLAAVHEARALLRWLERAHGPHVGVTGFSQGGSVAALVASGWSRPLAIVPVAAGHAAAPVFCDGALSRFADWDALGGEEGRARLRDLLEASDLERRPPPAAGSRAVLVAARDDGYVPASSVERLARSWRARGVEVETRWLRGGHASLLFRGHGPVAEALAHAMG
jgi:dienelactone hydrolase